MKRLLAFTLLGISGLALVGAGCEKKQTATTTNTDSEFIEDEIEVVTEDVYGKDLDIVERYPESIRSYYASNEFETDVTYQTEADMEDVRAFYNEKFTGAGWTNSEEATDYMEYVRGDEDNPEILTLYFTEYKGQSIVEYEVVYEPAFSEEELAELEDESEDEEF